MRCRPAGGRPEPAMSAQHSLGVNRSRSARRSGFSTCSRHGEKASYPCSLPRLRTMGGRQSGRPAQEPVGPICGSRLPATTRLRRRSSSASAAERGSRRRSREVRFCPTRPPWRISLRERWRSPIRSAPTGSSSNSKRRTFRTISTTHASGRKKRSGRRAFAERADSSARSLRISEPCSDISSRGRCKGRRKRRRSISHY